MTFTVACWEESAGEYRGWIACTREGFFAAQGDTREQAKRSLIRTMKANMAFAAARGEDLRIVPLPSDLQHHFTDSTEQIDV